MNKRFFIFSFLAVMCFAIGIRMFALGKVPIGLYWDEMAMFVDAKSVHQSGKDMHGLPGYQLIFPSYGDYKLPVLIWLASVSFKLFGPSEWALRLPSAVAGILTVIIAGLIAKRLVLSSGKKLTTRALWVQLSTMGVVASSPWSVLFSRTAFEGHIAQFFLALSILLVLKKSWKLLMVAAVIGAVATYTYFSVRFVWPVVFLASTVFVWKKELFSAKAITNVFVPLSLFFILLIPMTRSPWYAASNTFRLSTTSILNAHDYPIESNLYREQAGNILIDRVLFHRHVLLLKELARNYADHTSPTFLFLSGDTNLRHGTGEHGLFLLPFLIPFIIGWVYVLTHRRDIALLLGIWWIIALLPASVPENTPHALRSLNALVPFSIVIGIGTAEVIHWCLSLRFKTVKKFVFIAIAGVLGVSIGTFTLHYFSQYPIDSAVAWQAAYKETAQAMEEFKRTKSHDGIAIIDADELFYLWVMGYGSYTADAFHQSQSEQFKFKQFAGIATTAKEDKISGTYIVVTPKKRFDEMALKLNVLEKREVSDAFNTQQFVVALVRRN